MHPSTTNQSTLRRWFPRLAAVAVFAFALIASIAMPTSATAPFVEFHVTVGDCGLGGYALPSAALRIIVDDAQGHRKSSVHVTASAGSGAWSTGCLGGGPIKSGDQITARQDGMDIRLLVMPRFHFSVDRSTDVVSGAGPHNASLDLTLDACYPDGITCNGAAHTQSIPTQANGHFSVALSGGYDAIGGDRVTLQWTNTFNDVITRRQFVPYLQAQVGKAKVSGVGVPGTPIHVTLKSASHTLLASASATPQADGTWTATLRMNGSAVPVAVGDRLRGDFASAGSLNVVKIRAVADVDADTVSEVCLPNGRFGVRFRSGDGVQQTFDYGDLDSTGTKDSGGILDLDHGWTIRLWCGSTQGDLIHLFKTVH